MISLSKSGGTVTFTFDDNSTYLQNGTIEVPLNSLSLIIDESGMATFRKSASNDIFVSALYSEFGMSKAELEEWYKENMVGSAGIDSGAVQTMIDESISGKADTSALTVYFDDVEYDSSAKTINFYNDGVLKDSIDASDFVIDGMVDDVRIETISGDSYLVIDFNTASGKEDIQIPLSDIFNPDNYYTKTAIDGIVSGLNEDIDDEVSARTDADAALQSAIDTVSGNVETETSRAESAETALQTAIDNEASARTAAIEALEGEISGKADTSAVTAIQDSLSGYVETSAITTSVTSASTDSQIPTAKAVWEAASGGGSSYSAGRGISITNDTISFSLPISAGTGDNSIAEGRDTIASGGCSHAEGQGAVAGGDWSHAEGNYTSAMTEASHAEGDSTIASGYSSHAEGTSTQASGSSSHAEGAGTKANGDSSHAEGSSTRASGEASHAEGWDTEASGMFSHAEGTSTQASGSSSHAEGQSTKANGDNSHAEGSWTQTNGNNSHAEGWTTTTNAMASHAEGIYTIANNRAEHASGQYNVSSSASTTWGDSGNTLFSVGNGTAKNARHNAFEIRQNGDIYLSYNGNDVKLQDLIADIYSKLPTS